jgi:CubicO group peptidase (beta-lactamase class C family)
VSNSKDTPAPCAELGLDPEKLKHLVARAQRGIDEGPLPSVQIALARDGQLGLFTTLGDADNSRRYNIFSCTKALTAAAIWKLMGEDRLDISLPVCAYIDEFVGEGKERILVEQLLYHTAGIPHAPMGPPHWCSRSARMQKMQSWRLNWEPGSRMEYHATSAHWVLAEIIERLSGADYRAYIAGEILQPLGLDRFQLGVPIEQQLDITTLSAVGDPPSREELEKILGIAMDWPAVGDDTLLRFNEPETRALGVPGAGAVADAASVALFYQHLIHNQAGLWAPEVLARATGDIQQGFVDPATGVVANRGLGVVIAGDDGLAGRRGMAKNVSPRCFGHQGAGGQIAWGDPASGISFCLLTDGLDANPIRSARFGAAVSACAADACIQ